MDKDLLKAAQVYANTKYGAGKRQYLFAAHLANQLAHKHRFTGKQAKKERECIDGFCFGELPETTPEKVVFAVEVETKVTVKPLRFYSGDVLVETIPFSKLSKHYKWLLTKNIQHTKYGEIDEITQQDEKHQTRIEFLDED